MFEESQLRAHLRRGLLHRMRGVLQGFRLGSLGAEVFIDRDVELMRFPRRIHIGDHVVLKEGARICACNERAEIRIGARSTVGYHTFIFASESITIGEDCLIAPFVYLVDSNHGMSRQRPINQQANITAPIRVGKDVWIGARATILSGVTVGDGAVVATGATVNRDVEPYTVVGGTPAKVIGERG